MTRWTSLGMRAEVDPARIGIMGVSFHDAAYARTTTSVGSTRQAHGLGTGTDQCDGHH